MAAGAETAGSERWAFAATATAIAAAVDAGSPVDLLAPTTGG